MGGLKGVAFKEARPRCRHSVFVPGECPDVTQEKGPDDGIPFGKLGPFLKVSFCVGERQPAVRFEELLGEYVISRQESASASFESFVGLMGSSRER